jgi:tetratricopeptide (TPR) repeat protein
MVGKDDVNVQVVGARLLFNLGEHDEAQAIVTALSDHLDDAEHLGEALLFVTSQLAAARGELEAAEKGLRLGFSFEPENPEWGYVLSQVLLEQGRTKDALDAIQQARKHRPDAEPLGEAETNIRARLAAEAG